MMAITTSAITTIPAMIQPGFVGESSAAGLVVGEGAGGEGDAEVGMGAALDDEGVGGALVGAGEAAG